MSLDFSTALSLMAIGMITVFVVLLLVVITGKVLTRLVNWLDKGAEDAAIAPVKVAVISAAVEVFTEGKGHITKIDKE
ncbi:MAG: oxaloacetate decarboxylase [Cytophagales bacterium]|nr:oxaloacetate decarboxylase [Cytophagales bacterium]